jgi:hypothetical protein
MCFAVTSMAAFRRATAVQRRIRLLDRGEVDLRIFDAHVLSGPCCLAAGEHPAADVEEVVGDLVALIVRDENAVGCGFGGVSAGDHVDE